MWSKLKALPRGKLIWLSVGALVLVAALVAAVFVLLIPFIRAENTMDPQGILVVQEQEDGTMLLQWPAGENADSYWVTVTCEQETLVNDLTSQTQYVLPQLPKTEPVRIHVLSGCHWLAGVRKGDHALEAELTVAPPALKDLQWTADPETGNLAIRFSQPEEMGCRWYTALPEEEPVCIGEIEQGRASLTFGEGKDYPLPAYGADRTFFFAATLQGQGWELRGKRDALVTLRREDLLGTTLGLECTRGDSNVYQLSWNETKGELYEVQLSTDGENWETLAQIEKTQPHSYTSEPLAAFCHYQFRVIVTGGQSLPDSPYAAEPAVVEVETQERALRSTIWPLKELEVFSDPAMTQSVGKAAAGETFCLLEENQGAFGIRWGDGIGYIDSNYCMINLAEYMGNLCQYNITNSYSSLYMVHEFGIKDVSGKVIKGYERIRLADGSYVVPLLYPTAKKLIPAAQAAQEKGYRLKIYDSYRPNLATRSIYDLTGKIMADPVPVNTFSGKPVNDLDKLIWKPSTNDTQTGETEDNGEPTEPAETKPKWEGILEGLTYEILMTDAGRWGLNNFLAQGASNHNRGIALDMTLATPEGIDLQMQTSMHDLSWYSETSRNNNNAYILRTIMYDAGFGGLGSEWWHFQDNDSAAALKPPALYGGVDLECWMYQNGNWRYRLANGYYLTDCEKTIDGISYRFDAQGYATVIE